MPLPDPAQELPPHQSTSAAWFGPAMASRNDWIERLDDGALAELEAASGHLLATGADLCHLYPADVTLPLLGPRLRQIQAEVLDGRGFALLRGLPVLRWGRRKSAVAFMLIGACLGAARPQNAQGHVLGHVRDMGLRSDDPAVRIYQTRERQTFHTDSCDIVGLLCLQDAKCGGDSALVSSTTLFNEMRRRRPDLAALLFQPLATDRRGEVAPGQAPFFEIPVFNWWPQGPDGRLSVIYQRQYLESAQRFADAPRITPQIREALDLFDALSNDPALHFLMRLEVGDIQLVHNHTLLHDRTAFEDWPDAGRRRHLLRLWLAPREARPLPPVFARRYGSVVPGERGGVGLTPALLQVPLDGL
ncbi:MAG: TauD/TfdA family dioxygenase [Rhodoferax sp.]|nr:TauD/TfdA family dioxygenase [Rhodoferax sp.]